jgi:hypothetical protein
LDIYRTREAFTVSEIIAGQAFYFQPAETSGSTISVSFFPQQFCLLFSGLASFLQS